MVYFAVFISACGEHRLYLSGNVHPFRDGTVGKPSGISRLGVFTPCYADDHIGRFRYQASEVAARCSGRAVDPSIFDCRKSGHPADLLQRGFLCGCGRSIHTCKGVRAVASVVSCLSARLLRRYGYGHYPCTG